MRLLQAIYMAFLVALVDWLSGCVSSATFKEGKLLHEESKPEQVKAKRAFHQLVETTIPLNVDDNELNADIYRPLKKSEPKTLVIMVPGSGNVSRKGEVHGDGVITYEEPLLMNHQWAEALTERGLFVLTYDKRTCTKKVNTLCRTNSQRDVDTDGIIALARDLDEVMQFVQSKLDARGNVRIVLMSTTQGAQTIALSKSLASVHGIVLLSPIVTDLESMWIKGLAHAATNAPQQKMRLMNQKESMISFFKSLKAGHFPEQSVIRGASVKFWRTWIDATNQTIEALRRSERSSLLLFSEDDSFSSADVLLSAKKQINGAKKISTKTLKQVDRNFVSKNGVAKDALQTVLAFIDGL